MAYQHVIIYRIGEAGVMVTGDVSETYSDMPSALSQLGKLGFEFVGAIDKYTAGLANADGNHVLVCKRVAPSEE